MTGGWPDRIYMALVHYPVMDKNRETIASAVTNLDLHDIARTCKTYGVAGYYVITPLVDQQELVRQILSHWLTGKGGVYNPLRQKALEHVRLKPDMADAITEIAAIHGRPPKIVVTTAKQKNGAISCQALRERMVTDPAPVVLAFGTAWGLCDAFMDSADHILEPLMADSDYNHLSVRSAAAIVLDRLLGR